LTENAHAFLGRHGRIAASVEWLRTNGHEAVHLRDEGLQRLPNGEIFQKAGREQRIVLTFDLDFGEILATSGGQIVSVILFRLRNTRASFVIQRLEDVLNQSSPALSQGAIVVVEDGRHRVRSLPIGS
jgi:predicted nuclease of predicted toxin-antitoxin system